MWSKPVEEGEVSFLNPNPGVNGKCNTTLSNQWSLPLACAGCVL